MSSDISGIDMNKRIFIIYVNKDTLEIVKNYSYWGKYMPHVPYKEPEIPENCVKLNMDEKYGLSQIKIVKNDTHKFSDVKKIRFVSKEYLSKGIKLGFHIYGDLKKDEVIDFKPFGVNITAKHIPSSRQAQEKQREIAKTIADFLKVPFKEGYLSRKDIRSAKKL